MSISPFNIVTDGYLCDTLSIAVNGYLCTVTVSPPIPLPTGETIVKGFGGFGYSTPYFVSPSRKRMWKDNELVEEKVKLITVTVIKDGIEYVQKEYTTDLTVEAKDVQFELTNENTDIKIKIFFNK